MTITTSEPEPGVLQILMDRPRARNALNLELVEELRRSIASEGARAIVLGSTSRESFSAGVDLKLADHERAQVSRALYGLYHDMRNSDVIIVAAASGHAVGGGAQLMIASDIRIAGPDAAIRFLGPGHGLAVGAWGLPSLVGRGRAMELLLSMRSVAATDALAIGLVESVDPEPLPRALALASHIVTLSPEAVAAVKRIASLTRWDEALTAERQFNDHWDGAIPVSSDDG
ncbi:MAG TPA: enoyl-CoA hydratase/isomerase family protein [Acidimicrobiia bacterium]|nr:enoyl-CoA hydratase/isomerase family protein [Acidimicrobiia bacterium]